MIQNNRNILESELNSKITELIINTKISKHFILTYKVIKCNILSNKKLPDIIDCSKQFSWYKPEDKINEDITNDYFERFENVEIFRIPEEYQGQDKSIDMEIKIKK